ncbi:hypothetical protein [Acinetobacter soli]|uniref:Uncharacterized protein n=1 Tax=Acinetobacter soli NIPH 2899 TaxID=1217677 RepID=A0ABP2U8B6_9GAMM|nr:hypothetical protein [Acinetobacter soli]ENV60989.1 hypothetical protein F950_00234 [Acinetobacter soli NIPH 2899]
MFKQKYIITVESESPPRICLGDKIYGAEVVSLEVEQFPDLVDLTWLTKRFPLSRQTIAAKLEILNLGGPRKKLYDPNVVIPFLKMEIKNRKGRPRKN